MKSTDVLNVMQQVADWQLANPSKHPLTDWTVGALYNGITALGDLSPEPRYREAMMDIGRKTGWQPGPRVWHADDHCVGQMYVEMYQLYRDPAMIAPLRERFDDILAHPAEGTLEFKQPFEECCKRWSWCDALFMAPPAWIRLWAATGDARYLDFMVANWWKTSDYLYDPDEHLYYRDDRYFEKREANGKKVFWSRGNGWVRGG
ncbi:MAG: glycoside hydrolase family 88 protein, partial [bacterium]|nr:glycoside hydrolase family 88 protein [bacterium]